MTFPLGYHAELLGEYTERKAAQTRLLVYSALTVVAIFALLQAAFGSWRLATLTLLTLPMALVGGVLAAYLGGGVISLGSLVGFLTVLGIAARNGIMLINHYQHLESYEGVPFGPALVLRGAKERLAPILMTVAGHRPRAGAAGGARRHPRPRDRAPDGGGDPRRAGHLDPAQPVRRALALPALRQEPIGWAGQWHPYG